jgi:hypothetical protein
VKTPNPAQGGTSDKTADRAATPPQSVIRKRVKRRRLKREMTIDKSAFGKARRGNTVAGTDEEVIRFGQVSDFTSFSPKNGTQAGRVEAAVEFWEAPFLHLAEIQAKCRGERIQAVLSKPMDQLNVKVARKQCRHVTDNQLRAANPRSSVIKDAYAASFSLSDNQCPGFLRSTGKRRIAMALCSPVCEHPR